MKQVVQSIRTGLTRVEDIPSPMPQSGKVLVQVAASLISAGTERMVLDFAKKSLLDKARSRPDLVRQVMDKVKREGLVSTFESVRQRIDQWMPLGYSCAGFVVDSGGSNCAVGDLVACAGGGYAVHAEMVSVPVNLVAKCPEGVAPEAAAYATLGAIAMHGCRQAEVKLGEVVGVIGLGLVGQLTVQLLTAAGCTVVGMDLNQARAELALRFGARACAFAEDEFRAAVASASNGRGADSVIITADTESSRPVEVAAEVARDRAIVVAVGAVGLNIPRRDYYMKELDFRLGRSYGPGRYDHAYEDKGQDYPIGYVRWTEQRNLEAFVNLVKQGKLDPAALTTHRFSIEQGTEAYELISGGGKSYLGVILNYPQSTTAASTRTEIASAPSAPAQGQVVVGLLGAGNFASATLLPAMKQVPGIVFGAICSASGVRAKQAGEKHAFRYCSSDEQQILQDPAINVVAIATRHNIHLRQSIAALEAGKHVFCEKPVCLTKAELSELVARVGAEASSRLMVGYNRRFAPFVVELRDFLRAGCGPMALQCRVNAGAIPADHWVQDRTEGGGRIVGEACHFVDMLIYLTGALPVRVTAAELPGPASCHDNISATLQFADGSIGTIAYLANGDRSFSKERIEAFSEGSIGIMDDYSLLELVRRGKRNKRVCRGKIDKGHAGEWAALARSIREGGPNPVPFPEVVAGMLATFAIEESIATGLPIEINVDEFMSEARLQADDGTN